MAGMVKEILSDYNDFKRPLKPDNIDYVECPFCETGNGAVEFDSDIYMFNCLVCNYYWMKDNRFIKRVEKRGFILSFVWFLLGAIIGSMLIIFKI